MHHQPKMTVCGWDSTITICLVCLRTARTNPAASTFKFNSFLIVSLSSWFLFYFVILSSCVMFHFPLPPSVCFPFLLHPTRMSADSMFVGWFAPSRLQINEDWNVDTETVRADGTKKNKMQKASNSSRQSKVNLSKGRQSKLRWQIRNPEKWGEQATGGIGKNNTWAENYKIKQEITKPKTQIMTNTM